MSAHHLDDTNAPEHCSTTLHKQFPERLPNPPDLEYFHTPTPTFFLFSVLALGDRLGGGSALALGVLSATSGGRCLLLRSLLCADIATWQPSVTFPERLEVPCPLGGGNSYSSNER